MAVIARYSRVLLRSFPFLVLAGAARAQDPEILDTLTAVYPFSAPGEMTCNADASVVWIAEGGAIAFLDARTQAGMTNAIKRLQVGSLGIQAAGLVLDPGAVVANVDAYVHDAQKNLLYIAGERHGLWAYDADPRASVTNNLAVLLDDSGSDYDNGLQEGRRWCNGVELMTLTIAGVERTFLVALFAKKGGNRVRIYPLEMARQAYADALADSSPDRETAHVLSLNAHEVVSVRLPSNSAVPSFTPNPDVPEEDFAFAFGLAVDDSDPGQAYIYVALGMHGLVRIHCLPENLASPPGGGGPPPPVVQPGPYFGDDTSYASADVVYGHLELFRSNDQLAHRERPLFMDVAVQRDLGAGRLVYAAVDHLGWMRFDESTWGPAATIDHQEGLPMNYSPQGLTPTPGLSLFSLDDVGQRTYARRLELVELNLAAGGVHPVLLVTTGPGPARAWNSVFNEGRALSYDGQRHGKIPRRVVGSYSDGGHFTGYTLLYRNPPFGFDSTPLPDPPQHFEHLWQEGGYYVHAPPVQQAGATFVFFTGQEIALVDGDPPPPGTKALMKKTYRWTTHWEVTSLDRFRQDRPGRLCYNVGPLGDTNVLVAGGNDSSVSVGGVLYFDSSGDLSEMSPNPAQQDTFGIVFNVESQWPDAAPNRYWVAGVARNSDTQGPPAAIGQPYFALRLIEVGTQGSVPTWTTLQEYLIRPPRDNVAARFGYYGRGFVSAGLDALTQAQLGGRYLFLHMASQQSVYAVDRDDLVQRLAALGTGVVHDELFLTGDEQIARLDLNPVHGEMDQLYANADLGMVEAQSINDVDAVQAAIPGGAITSSPGRFHDFGTMKILAIPGNTVLLDPAHPLFAAHTDWLSEGAWASNFSHLFVRFYDVTTPGDVRDLPTYFGPDPESSTQYIDIVSLDDAGGTRVFLIVADFAGKLIVHEITDLESWTGPFRHDVGRYGVFASWELLDSVSDNQESNLFGLAVDKQLVGPNQDERVIVYLAGWKTGIRILEFDPFDRVDGDVHCGQDGCGDGQLFQDRGLLQTTGHASGLHLQPGNPKRLFLADTFGGIRVYGD